jgi:predicted helicase
LHDLVSDWGGFEKLVADLCDTGDVRVDRDVNLKGKSGAPRQIDVVIRHSQGFVEHLILVECKYWKDNVERAQVDAFATTLRDLNASRGIIFSSNGFQSGAVTQARHEGI